MENIIENMINELNLLLSPVVEEILNYKNVRVL